MTWPRSFRNGTSERVLVAADGQDGAVVEGRGPATVSTEGWTFGIQHGLPPALDRYRTRVERLDEIDLSSSEGDVCFVAATRSGAEWPALIVAQRYVPAGFGFNPGIAFVPDSEVLFIGAGSRLLAYSLAEPRRLWEDAAELGFWHWSVHDDAVLMAAELELAAWDRSAGKLWTTFVEPPWTYRVAGATVHLDVMGTVSEFSIMDGPGSGG